MKKLLSGILDFRKRVQPGYRETFARLALGQSPDALFVACSDSRVVPNLFASTNPGDLFVVRNVGNMVPPADNNGVSMSDKSEAAALEFSLTSLNVDHVIICGHSECGAMRAVMDASQAKYPPNLSSWLRHAESALAQYKSGISLDPSLAPHNQVGQLNVLEQLAHVRSYPEVQQRVAAGKLRLHGWWFDIPQAEVYVFDEARNRFVLLDEHEAERILDLQREEAREERG